MNIIIFPSETRSGSGVSEVFSNDEPNLIGGVQVRIDVAEVLGKGSLDLTLEAVNANGTYSPRGALTGISIPSTAILTICPEPRAFPVSANVVVHGQAPAAFRVRYDISGDDAAYTFGVDAKVI